MLLMRDSVTAADIPLTDLAAVAGYADGNYQWSSADWARFAPPIVSLSIAVHPDAQADILDVETGDATPDDCPGWCDRFDRPGRRAPTLYCNLSNWGAVIKAVGARRPDYWIADYYTDDPTKVLPLQGAVAVQYHDFGGYDESVVFDPAWLGVPVEMTMDMARLTVWPWYPNFCGRVGAQSEVDYWANQLIQPNANYEAVITAFYGTSEATAWRAKLAGTESGVSTLQTQMAGIGKAAS